VSLERLWHWTCDGCGRCEVRKGYGLPDGWVVVLDRVITHRCPGCAPSASAGGVVVPRAVKNPARRRKQWKRETWAEAVVREGRAAGLDEAAIRQKGLAKIDEFLHRLEPILKGRIPSLTVPRMRKELDDEIARNPPET
jgi:hypothetical protein